MRRPRVALALPVLGLTGLLLVAVTRWRETANRARCQDNLRRLGWFALWQYADPALAFPGGPDFADRAGVLRGDARPDPDRAFPPGTLPNPDLPPQRRLSWQVILLPQLGQDDVYRRFDRAKAWDDEVNRAAVQSKVVVLACPSTYRVPGPGEAQLAAYVGMAGLGADAPSLPPTNPRAGFFRHDGPTTAGLVKRGFSHTMTMIETERDRGPWAAGGRPTLRGVDTAEPPYVGPGRQFGAHAGGCNVAFADGSVRFLSHTISARVFEALVPLAAADGP